MGKRRKHKAHGHYCWACDRYLSNQKFSGRGHSRHLCKACSKLGKEELAYRQALRNLARCVTWDGIIPRKRRKQFDSFLSHSDPRIREEALILQKVDERARALMRDDDDDIEIDFVERLGLRGDDPDLEPEVDDREKRIVERQLELDFDDDPIPF